MLINTPNHAWGSGVYWWQTAGDVAFNVGDRHIANSSFDMTFDVENFDFTSARLVLWAYAREYDSTSSNESGDSNITLLGADIWGTHRWRVSSADFVFEVTVEVTPVN